MTEKRTTRILGVILTRTDRKASADGTGYYLWRCSRCQALVNGAGLSTYNHVKSVACRAHA